MSTTAWVIYGVIAVCVIIAAVAYEVAHRRAKKDAVYWYGRAAAIVKVRDQSMLFHRALRVVPDALVEDYRSEFAAITTRVKDAQDLYQTLADSPQGNPNVTLAMERYRYLREQYVEIVCEIDTADGDLDSLINSMQHWSVKLSVGTLGDKVRDLASKLRLMQNNLDSYATVMLTTTYQDDLDALLERLDEIKPYLLHLSDVNMAYKVHLALEKLQDEQRAQGNEQFVLRTKKEVIQNAPVTLHQVARAKEHRLTHLRFVDSDRVERELDELQAAKDYIPTFIATQLGLNLTHEVQIERIMEMSDKIDAIGEDLLSDEESMTPPRLSYSM